MIKRKGRSFKSIRCFFDVFRLTHRRKVAHDRLYKVDLAYYPEHL